MSYESYQVKSVEKALRILKLFNSYEEVSLTMMSEMLGVHKSTAYRLAMTLCNEGFLRWDNQKGVFRLGLKVLELSASLIHGIELRNIARPYLEKLQQELGEFIHLGILDDGNVVYIDKIEGKKSIRLYSEIGKRVPCHCTALGKVLLADLSDHEVKNMLKGKSFKRYTSNTIKNLHDYLDHLEEVREKGYAKDIEEHEPMVHCVAAPVRDYTGKCIAALSVTSIVKRFNQKMIDHYCKCIMEVAQNISEEMGYYDNSG